MEKHNTSIYTLPCHQSGVSYTDRRGLVVSCCASVQHAQKVNLVKCKIKKRVTVSVLSDEWKSEIYHAEASLADEKVVLKVHGYCCSKWLLQQLLALKLQSEADEIELELNSGQGLQ